MTDWAKIREKITELQKAGDVLQVPVNWEEIGKKLAELQTGGDTAPDQSVQEEDKTAEKSETAKAESGQTSGSAEDGNGAGSVPSGQTDAARIREGVRLLLEGIGEDPSREGLLETPERIARMYQEIFCGKWQSASEPLAKTFRAEHTDLVLEKDITFYSTCEHHLLPFYGKAHVAYIPGDRVVGLSKLARTVEIFARRLQLQERMTTQIADAVMEYLKPAGVMVMLEAEHMCMTMRGIRKPGSQTVTFAARGVFQQDRYLQEQFFQMVR